MWYLLAFISFLVQACVNPQLLSNDCQTADNITRVNGKLECMAMRVTRGTDIVSSPKLMVFLHGDTSRGGPSDRQFKFFTKYANKEVVFVGLIRPGYFDSEKNESTGNNFGRKDNSTSHNIEAVANALAQLKDHYKASKLLVVGYSGGGATTSVILGKYPGVIDDAVLIACPCHINPSNRSLSPDQFIDKVPKGTRVLAITGSNDSKTPPTLAINYVNSLNGRGIEATFIEAPGADHDMGIFGSDILENGINNFLK